MDGMIAKDADEVSCFSQHSDCNVLTLKNRLH
jgi:hypothetical protein